MCTAQTMMELPKIEPIVGSLDKDFLRLFPLFGSPRPKSARNSWHLNSGSAHIFLARSATLDLSAEAGWRDVQAVNGLLVLCGHACRVFASQPTRLFLHGFYVCGPLMELWVFDRSGIYSRGSIDMRGGSADILPLMLGYQLMADKDLGQSTIIKRDNSGNFITLENATIAGMEKVYLEDSPIALSRELGKWTYVVKFKWRRAQDRPEERLLKLAKQRKAWGVVSLEYHKEVDSTANLRHGLHNGRYRRPLRTFVSALELVQVFRDAILHQDVSAPNIIISDQGGEDRPRGILIDLDVAMDPGAGPRTPGELTGTRPFMSIGILKRRQPHRYRHDLESFLYVFLWTVISNRESWDDSAGRKMFEMRKENFGAVLDEFPGEFDSLKGLAETLRDALFPLREGQLWTGTDGSSEAANRLYEVMIGAFDAVARSESSKLAVE
ncbi:hypothetical protein N658DRAFT_563488 [Parathielavia hyrcaniae]|uniref:Fungal-type protein kinase domain-containing protein n=1 Tax=Parathielavia hyrcaniae TaxID=113614 RepID=A0AAN6QAP5_9PEZI|nr:hypothetical protein N658DRAFT_563488 [Parathielavia hyrcaniae]